MFASLLGLPFIGGILKLVMGPVLQTALTWQQQKLTAAGSHEARLGELAQREIDLDKREAEVNGQVLIAEQGNWFTRSMRPLGAMPFWIFEWKVIVWDKVLGDFTHGRTDPLDPAMWKVFMAVVISYYGGRTAELVATKITGVFSK